MMGHRIIHVRNRRTAVYWSGFATGMQYSRGLVSELPDFQTVVRANALCHQTASVVPIV